MIHGRPLGHRPRERRRYVIPTNPFPIPSRPFHRPHPPLLPRHDRTLPPPRPPPLKSPAHVPPNTLTNPVPLPPHIPPFTRHPLQYHPDAPLRIYTLFPEHIPREQSPLPYKMPV